MEFTLHIDLDNAAMKQPDHVAATLEGIAHRLRREGFWGTDSAPIKDINGNTVGAWHLHKSRAQMLAEPPEALADAWARYQAGGDVSGYELSKLDEWRADVNEELAS